jgi:hypothetical protein
MIDYFDLKVDCLAFLENINPFLPFDAFVNEKKQTLNELSNPTAPQRSSRPKIFLSLKRLDVLNARTQTKTPQIEHKINIFNTEKSKPGKRTIALNKLKSIFLFFLLYVLMLVCYAA